MEIEVEGAGGQLGHRSHGTRAEHDKAHARRQAEPLLRAEDERIRTPAPHGDGIGEKGADGVDHQKQIVLAAIVSDEVEVEQAARAGP